LEKKAHIRHWLGPCFFFFVCSYVVHPVFFWKKNLTKCHWFAKISVVVVIEKSGLFLPKNQFSTYFWHKTPIKYRRNHDKPIYDIIKPRKPPHEPKSTRIQKLIRVRMYFFMSFKAKNIYSMNFSHQMQSFDTNIVCFGDLNQYQWHFFSHRRNLTTSLSPLSIRNYKITKMNSYTIIELEKILRYWNCIICESFKVLRIKMHLLWNLWNVIHVWHLFYFSPSSFSSTF